MLRRRESLHSRFTTFTFNTFNHRRLFKFLWYSLNYTSENEHCKTSAEAFEAFVAARAASVTQKLSPRICPAAVKAAIGL